MFPPLSIYLFLYLVSIVIILQRRQVHCHLLVAFVLSRREDLKKETFVKCKKTCVLNKINNIYKNENWFENNKKYVQ